MAYERLEPFGPLRDDDRFGVVAATLANIYRDSSRRSEPFHPSDFFPRMEDKIARAETEETAPAPATLESKLTAWAMMMADQKKAKPLKRPRKGGNGPAVEGPPDKA